MATEIKPVRSDEDHAAAMLEIGRLWGSPIGSPDGDRLDVLVTLVEAYEIERWPMGASDPIEAIKARLEQKGLSEADLVPLIGSRESVAEVLDRRRELTLAMIRSLHRALGIPAEVLIREVVLEH